MATKTNPAQPRTHYDNVLIFQPTVGGGGGGGPVPLVCPRCRLKATLDTHFQLFSSQNNTLQTGNSLNIRKQLFCFFYFYWNVEFFRVPPG